LALHARFEIIEASMRERSHLRLTHEIMAIGVTAPVGLLAFAAIYRIGSWSKMHRPLSLAAPYSAVVVEREQRPQVRGQQILQFGMDGLTIF
jgi:hypothetical protein